MAVRFLPQGDPHGITPPADREELAEVLDLRSRLPRIIAQNEAAQNEAVQNQASHDEAAQSVVEDRSNERTTNEDGVRLLARKALSSGELRRELLALGHARNEVENLIEEFVSGLYLDDLGLARVLTESLRERKRASRSQIRMKLRERLLPDHAIDEALGELDDDEELELLRTVAQDRAKRLGGLDRVTAERRLLGFLARRGWSGERATRIAREALSGQGISNNESRGSVRFQ